MSVTDPQDVRRDDGWAPDAPAYAVVVPTIGRECLADCLAALAADRGALIVHYSSDYVFDGAKAGSYVESDVPAPLNAYGRSKLAGERAVRAMNPAHLLFRTSWVYGAFGDNFLKTVLMATAFVGALFAPSAFAQEFGGTDVKVCGFFESINGLLSIASIAVVTIAVIVLIVLNARA